MVERFPGMRVFMTCQISEKSIAFFLNLMYKVIKAKTPLEYCKMFQRRLFVLAFGKVLV
jgi:hypothetical protein